LNKIKILKFLCICTFVWSGALALVGMLGLVFTGLFGDVITNAIPMFGDTGLSTLKVFFLMVFLTYTMSVSGAIGMFNLRRNGFFLYLLPNICELAFQIYFITKLFTPFNFVYLLVSILFIVLYSLKLKLMD
jgi:hypothetical protein